MITCDRLSKDSMVLDMHVTDKNNVRVDLKKVYDVNGTAGIYMDIPRTNTTKFNIEGTFWA